ncbi:magnesium transporter [Phanerochaete sordida]|uniref:Magnesium transporter n=1 Tax=Phanerochaete sordida TaxID=48140 RepID=A0A9P3G5U0_9APHY|nr:magnesium transporter [Phanerochaete sordida]
MHEADCADADSDPEPPLELVTLESDALKQKYFHGQLQTVYEVEHGEDSETDDDSSRALLSPRQSTSPQPPSTTAWRDVRRVVIETGPTLVLTTVGLLFSGVLLNAISRWRAMTEVNELIMIIPVILNLKGNLEMNLSARLGTAANIGELDRPAVRRKIILGNLSLLQVQATIVSFVAAILAFALARVVSPQPAVAVVMSSSGADLASNFTSVLRQALDQNSTEIQGPNGLDEFVLTASSSMLATCLSSALLGVFMSTLVVLCRKIGADPDNIAPPVAACLGDLVPLVLLGAVSALNFRVMHTPLPLVLLLALLGGAVGWVVVTRRNDCVRHLLWQGWLPLFVAMVISCAAGMILDVYVGRYEGFAILAILISGLPGNVGAIVVSRLSTALHASSDGADRLPCASADVFPKAPAMPSSEIRIVMLTLPCVTFPIEVAFLVTLRAVGWLRVTVFFLIVSIGFFCIAVVASLYLAKLITDLLWKHRLDPDIYALPIHSAIVDLVGLLLLVVCFELVSYMGMSVHTGIDDLM